MERKALRKWERIIKGYIRKRKPKKVEEEHMEGELQEGEEKDEIRKA